MSTNDPKCGCASGIERATPVEVMNRPGLSAIGYRVGRHATFKASMLARLSGRSSGRLAELTTRSDDDFTIALIDAWASVLDVLTFYQERHANEGYLHTATERLSVLELARLIGYELVPGVAASVALAFTVGPVPAPPPDGVPLEVGTRAQSVPGPNETPQTFETIEPIVARAEWSVMSVQTSALDLPAPGMTSIAVKGLATRLQKGDRILFVQPSRKQLRRLDEVIVEPANDLPRTVLKWTEGLHEDTSKDAMLFALGKRVGLFGANASDWMLLDKKVRKAYPNGGANLRDWPGIGNWQSKVLQPSAASSGAGASSTPMASTAMAMELAPVSISIAENELSEVVTAFGAGSAKYLSLEGAHPEVSVGDWVAVLGTTEGDHDIAKITAIRETTLSAFGVSGKATSLQLEPTPPARGVRRVRVYLQTQKLEIAPQGVTAPLPKNGIPLAKAVPALSPGRKLIFSGKTTTDKPATELATLMKFDTSDDPDHPRLLLLEDLKTEFDRDELKVYGNVADATQGESVAEILGNGSAGVANQSFALRHKPLTYVGSDDPGGSTSTLSIRVNDVAWHEVPTLYARGPTDRVFETRRTDEGTTEVVFGDGREGARLPSGTNNVRATYRKGLGSAGNVRAEQISLLLSRPLGLTGVNNPLAASGGADPETLDAARRSAPLRVRTLDRVVSLEDFRSFALAFAGVSHADATFAWDGRERCIAVSVAGTGVLASPAPGQETAVTRLRAAFAKAGTTDVPVRVVPCRVVEFRAKLSLDVDPDYDREAVRSTVEQRLRAAFAIEARAIGAAVDRSDVVAVAQAVPGVLGVDLDAIRRVGHSVVPRIIAKAAGYSKATKTLVGAEILVLDDAPITVKGVIA